MKREDKGWWKKLSVFFLNLGEHKNNSIIKKSKWNLCENAVQYCTVQQIYITGHALRHWGTMIKINHTTHQVLQQCDSTAGWYEWLLMAKYSTQIPPAHIENYFLKSASGN